MYTAQSIARHIIDFAAMQDRGVSNLKLQKLLYFVQAQFLFTPPRHSACFKDRIEAWDFGPVVPNVYHQYKSYGAASIIPDENDPMLPYYDTITPEDQNMIDALIAEILPYSASALVDITHRQDPWRKAYVPGCNREITTESIRSYFALEMNHE